MITNPNIQIIEAAGEELKDYLVERCSMLLEERDFLDALPGHLLPDAASQARSALIIDRLKTIAGFRSFKGGVFHPDHSWDSQPEVENLIHLKNL